MKFNDVIKNRYSVRKYTDEKVSQELINEILETGRLAPSVNNNQPTIDRKPIQDFKMEWVSK